MRAFVGEIAPEVGRWISWAGTTVVMTKAVQQSAGNEATKPSSAILLHVVVRHRGSAQATRRGLYRRGSRMVVASRPRFCPANQPRAIGFE
ncbi:hypothetical protein JAAARDRAFT_530325 [Jaapia argillacea MUCL 33604]|uniref:Uncharacterized protein n=1 Tax=Jaapia argillacea MUCL 33604 TaxID=933084 RepID=A0A067P9M5_9AGAM|nr:hypothetical protein JAAARDRAFT_530325 [Jaapia argillacea MUCL 33604]